MANNVTYVTAEATPIKGTIVETEQQADGSQRQIIALGEMEETGTLGALDAEVAINCHCSIGTIVFQVSGTWSGKIVAEGTIDGVYNNLSIVQPGGAIAFTGVNNDNQNGVYRVLLPAGYSTIRLRMSSYTSGTATVVMRGTQVVPTTYAWQLNAANLQTTTTMSTTDKAVLDDIAANQTDGSQKTKIIGTDGSGLDVYTRTQTPTNKVIGVQIGPGDVISNLPVIVLYDHHQIHEGETWRWSVFVSSLASGVSKDIQLVVPNITIPVGANPVTLCPHFRFEVICDSLSNFYLYEAPTITVNGTGRTPINQERNGSYTPKLAIYEDPTVTGVGTQIFQGVTFASKTAAGAADTSENEFVLKNNTTYLLRVTSGTAGAKVLIRMIWYEDLGV